MRDIGQAWPVIEGKSRKPKILFRESVIKLGTMQASACSPRLNIQLGGTLEATGGLLSWIY
jgi:hypothetical protein